MDSTGIGDCWQGLALGWAEQIALGQSRPRHNTMLHQGFVGAHSLAPLLLLFSSSCLPFGVACRTHSLKTVPLVPVARWSSRFCSSTETSVGAAPRAAGAAAAVDAELDAPTFVETRAEVPLFEGGAGATPGGSSKESYPCCHASSIVRSDATICGKDGR